MKIIKFFIKIFFIAFATIFLFAGIAQAANIGDWKNFYVDKGYDASGRSIVKAVLVKSGFKANIYVDESWWNFTSQSAAESAINSLSVEFDNRIHPILTGAFGQEWDPGIDKDSKITILIQSMNGDAGGYFRTNDEHPKLLVTDSNEREMIYVNSKHVSDANLKSFVAHEFMHLITFNQKNVKFEVEEDTWLNEARAEYVSTMLGYNDNYENSYLEKRVQYFSEKPSGSLIDWQDAKYSYSRVSLFVHYLVDQYGINILVDSLHSSQVGIDSINYALQKNGFKENFFKIFIDWTITVVVNDCDYGENYCYLDKNLKNFYIFPSVNFLPVFGSTTLTFADNTKYWTGNWYKLIGGGGGSLKFSFEGDSNVSFKIPYIKKNKPGSYIIDFMSLSQAQKGEFSIENFGKDITALFVIPSLQNDTTPADDKFYHLSWSASITRQQSDDSAEIQRLLAIIESLKKQIAELQQGVQNCLINNNLYFGMTNNNEVKCLQTFLKNQGVSIYPEGLITGNFGSLTKTAVIRFQAKYGISQTGYVGPITRAKINSILSGI